MAFTFGFYNSVNEDRKYDARDFSRFFDGIIVDGVLMHYGNRFFVKPGQGEMQIIVQSGRAWYDGTWNYNDGDMVIDLDASEPLLNRIDAVVIDVNRSDYSRLNELKIIKGNPSSSPSKPTLIKSTLHNQYPIAYITVNKGVTNITTANIESKIGTSDNPFATGVLETMDIDELIAQWGAQWTERIERVQNETEEWNEEQHRNFLIWLENEKNIILQYMATFKLNMDSHEADFNDWFQNLEDTLSSNQAGNLTIEIGNVAQKEFEHYYDLVNKETTFTIDSTGNKIITEISSDMVATTNKVKNSEGTTITTNLVPSNGNWNYKKIVKIVKTSSGTKITESYTKIGKGG